MPIATTQRHFISFFFLFLEKWCEENDVGSYIAITAYGGWTISWVKCAVSVRPQTSYPKQLSGFELNLATQTLFRNVNRTGLGQVLTSPM
jgi:hypothetical protein